VAGTAPRPVPPLPEGFGLILDRSVRAYGNGTVLLGGQPGRLVALTPAGAGALQQWLEGGGTPTVATRQLGRRLVDAGMAHPVAPPLRRAVGSGGSVVTVVVPVRDRADSLDRCLDALGDRVPVIVVDDGSARPDRVAAVARRHRAQLIRRPVNGGPGAARNQALPTVDTELVAFVDSDCEVDPGWLDALVAHFGDPALGAVAPRVRPSAPLPAPAGRPAGRPARRSVLGRYADSRSPLDMGAEPGEVGPGRTVGYLPTVALVARRTALGTGFDERLRVGEDVDLVWRILGAGWRVRYEPSVTVHHREPASWIGLLGRRCRYGTSAGPLALRHPGRLAPLELRPWPTAVAAALVARRPEAALALLAGSTAAMAGPLRRHGVPTSSVVGFSARGAGWTVVGVGRAVGVLAGPVVVVGILRRWRWAATAAGLAVLPPLVDWWRRRPPLDPVRWSLASMADDAAYGVGVWRGCFAARSFGPLVPSVRIGRIGRIGRSGPAGARSAAAPEV
jgi:mycofactocin system glycosyltransferase